ncbi:MAG: hypothetical protein KA116_06305 [Proteobacteria bacterium]|nr:hypothetical protein [Pseudomonadota bacterium]
MEDFVWIQTRDNSPTLWSNLLGEPFRSYKGAFSESWSVFVEPVIKRAQTKGLKTLSVAEFGLGLGTNWLFTVSAAAALGITLEYWAIEKDLRAFELGLVRWKQSFQRVSEFFNQRAYSLDEAQWNLYLENCLPKVYSSLEEAVAQAKPVDNWYHDPFGFSVNSDGYSEESLTLSSKLWTPNVLGLSYACNRHFQNVLEGLGMKVSLLDQHEADLKRQRLEFSAV